MDDCIYAMDELISIHAAREGGDPMMYFNLGLSLLFQSTPPVKAATYTMLFLYNIMAISIHAAREGGDDMTSDEVTAYQISIHAAREGGDGHCKRRTTRKCHFNPRRP